eukprot:gb/GECH01013666.1/.p1 GENE.gb/GECH01013666.1/~~gb/GECH01013666.1/.p1  ORF type:complete len:307 (+),score=79.64 gb/GECH01013666.1/:1-921(+)
MSIKPEDVIVKQVKGEKIVRNEGDIRGNPFLIEKINGCLIVLLDYTDSINIDKAEKSRFLIGPCGGSVFIRDCKNCSISVYCKQLRLRDCKNVNLRVHVNTEPVIESSNNVSFSTIDFESEEINQLAQKSGLDLELNKYDQVYDFDHQQSGYIQGWEIKESSPITSISECISEWNQSENNDMEIERDKANENWKKITEQLEEDKKQRDQKEKEQKEKTRADAKQYLRETLASRKETIEKRDNHLKQQDKVHFENIREQYLSKEHQAKRWEIVSSLLPKETPSCHHKAQDRMKGIILRVKEQKTKLN